MPVVITRGLSSLQPLVERIAQLIEAEAVILLAVLPASASYEFHTVAAYGGALPATGKLDLENLFEYAARHPSSHLIPLDISRQIGTAPNDIGLAIPILSKTKDRLLGAVVIVFHRDFAHTQRAQAGTEIMVELARHEFEHRHEVNDLTGTLALAKALSARHIERFEQQRTRLATEVHDDLSQNTTCIRLALAALQRDLDAGQSARALSAMANLLRISTEVKDSLLNLSKGLGPAMLGHLGPVPAINTECELHTQATGVEVSCHLADLRLPEPVSLALIRIVQESLANIARHARATHVDISLRMKKSELHFTVEDDGCGFNPHQSCHALGLLAMAERAEIAGGKLVVESQPGDGTRVVAIFPIGSLA